MDACYGFSVVLLRLKKDSPLTSIVLDYALTKFTPETPAALCGVKHFNLPLYPHSGEWIMSAFSFLDELSL